MPAFRIDLGDYSLHLLQAVNLANKGDPPQHTIECEDSHSVGFRGAGGFVVYRRDRPPGRAAGKQTTRADSAGLCGIFGQTEKKRPDDHVVVIQPVFTKVLGRNPGKNVSKEGHAHHPAPPRHSIDR